MSETEIIIVSFDERHLPRFLHTLNDKLMGDPDTELLTPKDFSRYTDVVLFSKSPEGPIAARYLPSLHTVEYLEVWDFLTVKAEIHDRIYGLHNVYVYAVCPNRLIAELVMDDFHITDDFTGVIVPWTPEE